MSFDGLLSNTISNLLEKHQDEGMIKLNLKIILSGKEDYDTHKAPKITVIPNFEYSLSSEIKEKAKIDGNLGGENYRLTQNVGSGLYQIIQSGTIYDYLDGEDDED